MTKERSPARETHREKVRRLYRERMEVVSTAAEKIAKHEIERIRATASPYDCGGNPTKDYPGE